jgi:hypothetical protein
MDRAITWAQVSMSFRVYPTTVGRPVVPDDAWIRLTRSLGTANMPYGYRSRRSCLVVKGNRPRSSRLLRSSGWTPASANEER